jgi:hypothetical protein
MKSLFLKIFLSFWLAQALIVALVVLATLAIRQQAEFAGTPSKPRSEPGSTGLQRRRPSSSRQLSRPYASRNIFALIF